MGKLPGKRHSQCCKNHIDKRNLIKRIPTDSLSLVLLLVLLLALLLLLFLFLLSNSLEFTSGLGVDFVLNGNEALLLA